MLTGRQQSIITGSLLGDGAMRCKRNALLEINHSIAQREYVEWKYRELAPLVTTPPKLRKNNGSRTAYRFTTRSVPDLTPFFERFYSSGRKRVPNFALTPLALAVWFMDDGCRTRSAVYLNTQQFELLDQFRLLDMLREQCGLVGTLNRDKSYHRIRIRTGSADRFRKIVEPELLPQFVYKLPDLRVPPLAFSRET